MNDVDTNWGVTKGMTHFPGVIALNKNVEFDKLINMFVIYVL